MILGYYLESDDYMSDLSDENRYDVVRQYIAEDGELDTSIEWENCTLAQARERLKQLYRTKPPEGVVQ